MCKVKTIFTYQNMKKFITPLFDWELSSFLNCPVLLFELRSFSAWIASSWFSTDSQFILEDFQFPFINQDGVEEFFHFHYALSPVIRQGVQVLDRWEVLSVIEDFGLGVSIHFHLRQVQRVQLFCLEQVCLQQFKHLKLDPRLEIFLFQVIQLQLDGGSFFFQKLQVPDDFVEFNSHLFSWYLFGWVDCRDDFGFEVFNVLKGTSAFCNFLEFFCLSLHDLGTGNMKQLLLW
jgi:hypothetical protein